MQIVSLFENLTIYIIVIKILFSRKLEIVNIIKIFTLIINIKSCNNSLLIKMFFEFYHIVYKRRFVNSRIDDSININQKSYSFSTIIRVFKICKKRYFVIVVLNKKSFVDAWCELNWNCYYQRYIIRIIK